MFSDWVQKWINQIAHVGWGAFLVLAVSRHLSLFHAVLAVVVVYSIKEGIFDPMTETVSLRGSGWEDWAFWSLGVVLGLVCAR